MAPEELQRIWAAFREESEARAKRLIEDLAGSCSDILALLEEVQAAFEVARNRKWPAASLESLRELLEGPAQALLFNPLGAYRKRRPLQRAFQALQDYDAALEDLVRRLPASVEISGRDLVGLIEGSGKPSWRSRWLRLFRSAKPVALRAVAADHFQRQALSRASLDGSFQLLLARACLLLLPLWHVGRRQALRGMEGGAPDPAAVENDWQAWRGASAGMRAESARLLGVYRQWASAAAGRMANAVLRRPAESSQRHRERRAEKRQRNLSYWSRQLRAVYSVLDLELQLSTLTCDAAGEARESLESLQSESRELVAELDAVIAWLRSWPRVDSPATFPPPGVRLLSAEERLRQLLRRVSERARLRLPATVETIEPRRALPGWRGDWRELEPAKVFAAALEQIVPAVVLEGLGETEASHRAIVREIERAREVVTFGMESAQPGTAGGEAMLQEAVRNALSLLEYQKRAADDSWAPAEKGLVRAQAVLFLECHRAFEKGRLGLLAHLTRQRGRQAARQARQLAIASVREAVRKTTLGARHAYRWMLLKIGWLAPPRADLEPVSRRARLGGVLDVQLQTRDLPAIYRRLFRLAPVEDARFLVGRDSELEGLEEALARWRSGLPASVIVVGARGSGKTSLLNCAVSSIFTDVEVVRGQFSDRVTDRAQLRVFLDRLLGIPEGAELAAVLAAKRRVVILEELERTFLRAINGFEALREFLDLMHSSAGSTLWVLGVNETAFRYLDASTGLGQFFSHRVNAMSVAESDLIRAIMQRHNLSGLRLQFAPLPEEDPRVSRLRRLLGLEQDVQQLFFDALFQQSEGIFRAAFELWQGSIERVEGGVVHMRQPLVPDYRPLASELTLDDFFTLQAVLQHGSLTEDEHGRVLCIPPEKSRRRMERLESLEILEPEPGGPGLRIRPEAGRFVRDTLHRQNLV